MVSSMGLWSSGKSRMFDASVGAIHGLNPVFRQNLIFKWRSVER